MPEAEKKEAELSRIGVHRSVYHVGAFKGNNIVKILKNLDKFGSDVKCTSYFNTLVHLECLRKSCFGMSIYSSFQQTDLRPLVKVHLLFHFEEYFKILDAFSHFHKPGLAWLSEHSIESSHHHFLESWRRYIKSPKDALKRSVLDFNYTLDSGQLLTIHFYNHILVFRL